MSSALLAALFAILGTGLAVTSTACFVLWRRVRALTVPEETAVRREITVSVPGRGRSADRPPGLFPGIDSRFGPRNSQNDTTGQEVVRRLEELASRHLALETRLSRIEAATTEPAFVSEPAHSKVTRRVDPGRPATAEGPTLISVPNLASPPSSTSEAAAELDRRFGPIWGMADEGVPTESIARETGYPIGQVELILGLRRQLLVAGTGTGLDG